MGIEGDEGSTLVEESISPFRATIVQRQAGAKPTPVIQDSVAKPAVMHPGPEGKIHFRFKNILYVVCEEF